MHDRYTRVLYILIVSTMHKLTRLPEYRRRECYKLYKDWKEIQELADYYHVHRNTIWKIIARWDYGDFSVHKSIRETYRSLQYGLRRLDKIYERFKKKRDKYWSIVRYEKQYAWELVHIDLKKIKNVKGENPKKKRYLVGVIDDSTRIAYTEVVLDKKAKTVALVFTRACEWFFSKWVKIKAVLCDNGKEFTTHRQQWKPNHIFTKTCEQLWIKQKFTRVRRPQTNGKIERLWRTVNTELLTRIQFNNWDDVTKSLQSYMNRYNYARRHSAIAGTPMNKLYKQIANQ